MVRNYILFAFLATILNLTSQYLILSININLYIAILIGTLVGLLTKYILDKNFIFNYKPKNRIHDIKKFFLYSLSGFFTTLIFWSVELSFHFLFKYEVAKYIGGLIGLSIGYFLKFNVDRKYIFN